jgi:methyl-accepting chemotaxis protein
MWILCSPTKANGAAAPEINIYMSREKMRFTIRRKLAAGFSVLIVLMLFSATFAYTKMLRATELQEKIRNIRYPATVDAARIQAAIGDGGGALRAYVLFGSDAKDAAHFKAARADAWLAADAATSDLTQVTKDFGAATESEEVSSIAAVLKVHHQLQNNIEQLAMGQGNDAMGRAYDMLKTEAAAQQGELMGRLKALVDDQQQKTNKEILALADTSHAATLSLWTTTLIGILAGCVIAYVISKRISVAVAELLKRAQAISAGDLGGQELEHRSEDEIGDLMSAINTMQSRLREMIVSVAQMSGNVANSSEDLRGVSQQMSDNAEEASSQSRLVSVSVEEVSRNLQAVATATEEMSASIQEISKSATEATKVVRSAVSTAETTNESVLKLGKSSAEIGQVIKVITSIAHQTNLLALNATIEASRAGDAGKGFAVVANEVKELAKETAGATEEISRKIETMQGETQTTTKAIAEITAIITRVNSISNMIAGAVEDQTATTNEMVRNVNDAATGSARIVDNIRVVAGAAKSTTQGASETQIAARELSTMAGELRKLVAQFKHTGNNRTEPPVSKKDRSGLPASRQLTTSSKEKFETTAVGPR